MIDPTAGQQPHDRVWANAHSDGLLKSKCMIVDRFSTNPHILAYGTQAAPVGVPALPTALIDQIDAMIFPEAFGNQYAELYQTTAQTLMPIIHGDKGLQIGGDLVNNESLEIVLGGNRASNPLSCLVGTDPAILLEATFEIADVSGLDQFGIFLRKQENYAVPVSFLSTGDPTYTDIVLFGFAGAVATPNPIRISSDVGNGGSCTVQAPGFTVPDNGIVKLQLLMRGRSVYFAINGVPLGSGSIAKDGVGTAITAQTPVTPTPYTFTSGLRVVPGIFLRHDATTPGAVYWRSVACGQLRDLGYDNPGRD